MLIKFLEVQFFQHFILIYLSINIQLILKLHTIKLTNRFMMQTIMMLFMALFCITFKNHRLIIIYLKNMLVNSKFGSLKMPKHKEKSQMLIIYPFILGQLIVFEHFNMRKYIGTVINNLIPPYNIIEYPNDIVYRLTNFFQHRKVKKECINMWNYSNETNLLQDLTAVYANIKQSIKQQDEPLLLRHISIELYDKYTRDKNSLKLEQKIYDAVIIYCKKVKALQMQSYWMQCKVRLHHKQGSKIYVFERKIPTDSYNFQKKQARKWYLSHLPE